MREFEYYKKGNEAGIALGWDDCINFALDFKESDENYKQISLEEFRNICCKYNCLHQYNDDWFEPIYINC